MNHQFHWAIRGKLFEPTDFPIVMGILNITPNSFSDGGLFYQSGDRFSGKKSEVNLDLVLRHARCLVESGADILDIGGESTAPGAMPVEPIEQIRRVVPVIRLLQRELNVPVSIDTTSARVAQEAVQAGAGIINDISGGTFDPEICEVVRLTGAGYCCSHLIGSPDNYHQPHHFKHVVDEVEAWLQNRRSELIESGIDPRQLVFDPGLGFGKGVDDNIELVRKIDRFQRLKSPALVGHSRKRFLRALLPKTPDQSLQREEYLQLLDCLTAAVSVHLAYRGTAVLRVHNVAATMGLLKQHRIK